MLEIIKSFFSPVGGGRTSFASQNGNIQRKEDLRQEYNNSSSNSDFNRKRGEEYLISSSFASENIVGGGQLRSNNYSASSRSYKGGEGNCTSLMSSDFAGTETMLNPDYRVGGAKSIWIRLFRKGASHYLGRCVATSRTCSLLMDASRMTSVLIHEMWKEVAD